MGANAQTSVPAFTTGQVLTAQQQTEINTGVPVFATTTTRDAAFGGTGEKVLAQGQLAYIEASDVVQYYNGTAWATLAPASASALTLVTSQTFSAAATVSMASGTFSSTYQNYLVLFQTSASSATQNIGLRVNSSGTARTATNYYGSKSYSQTGGSVETVGSEGVSSINAATATTANNVFMALQVFDPLSTSVKTSMSGTLHTMSASGNNFGVGTTGGVYNVAEANDGLTFFVTGTITGNYRVYGYSNS